jgi:MoaD family protein
MYLSTARTQEISMRINIKFFTILREITGKREERIQFSKAINVEELLNLLSEKYGESFVSYVCDDRKKTRDSLQFLLNGRNIAALNGFKTKLKDGDEIAIIPPIGGG